MKTTKTSRTRKKSAAPSAAPAKAKAASAKAGNEPVSKREFLAQVHQLANYVDDVVVSMKILNQKSIQVQEMLETIE
jgi:hypothetical protein